MVQIVPTLHSPRLIGHRFLFFYNIAVVKIVELYENIPAFSGLIVHTYKNSGQPRSGNHRLYDYAIQGGYGAGNVGIYLLPPRRDTDGEQNE